MIRDRLRSLTIQVYAPIVAHPIIGKCTNLSVALPVAALYTHHIYKQIASFHYTGGSKRNTDIVRWSP